MGKYAEYYPIRFNFDLAPQLIHFDNKLLSIVFKTLQLNTEINL